MRSKARSWLPAAIGALAACTPAKAPRPAPSSPAPSAAALASPAPMDIEDVAFQTPEAGWALGTAAAGKGVLLLARTADGGASWSAPLPVATVPADQAYGATVRFAGASDGWVSGPFGLFATTDGGKSWARAGAVTGTVGAVAASGASAWALGYPCAPASQCTPVLLESGVGQAAWRPAVVQPQLIKGLSELHRVSADKAFVVLSASPGQPVAWQVTADGGASWHPFASPCGQLGGFGDALSSLDGSTIWVACASEPGAGIQLKQVLVSIDGGGHWEVRASTADFGGSGATGTLTEGGSVSGLSLLSPATGLMSLSRGGVLRSTDGGRDWSDVALPGVPFGDPSPTVRVLDGTHAWIVLGNGSSEPGRPQLFRTSDAGATWAAEPAPLSGP